MNGIVRSAALLLAVLATNPASAAAPDSGSVALRCGALIDGVSGEARGPTTVVIVAGRIAEVSPGAAVPSGVRVLELADHTCLPGLIDMHTHLTDRPGDTADLSVYYRRTLDEQLVLARENARATLLAGFTTVRDVGTYIGWADRALRDEINAGITPGPRMQVVGFYLTIPGGGGDLVIPGFPESAIPAQVRLGVSRGPEQFRRARGTRGCRRRGPAQGDRVRRGACLRRRAGCARDDARGNRGSGRSGARARTQGRRARPRRRVDSRRHPGRSRHDRACVADRRGRHRACEAAAGRAVHGRLQRRPTSTRRGAPRAGPRSSCARTSRPPRRSGRASPPRMRPACRSSTAPMPRCTRTA